LVYDAVGGSASDGKHFVVGTRAGCAIGLSRLTPVEVGGECGRLVGEYKKETTISPMGRRRSDEREMHNHRRAM
jgi:hypothetical protein